MILILLNLLFFESIFYNLYKEKVIKLFLPSYFLKNI